MTNETQTAAPVSLPELPEPPAHMHYASYTKVLWHPPAPYEYPPDGTGLYTADQMREYARQALTAAPQPAQTHGWGNHLAAIRSLVSPLQFDTICEVFREQDAIAAAPRPQEIGLRDAHEGAREDLLDWKRRAQKAEATLRSLGYTGITPDTPPAHGDGDETEMADSDRLNSGKPVSPREIDKNQAQDSVFSPWNACCYREQCRANARALTARPSPVWDARDAARYRWLRDCDMDGDRSVHTTDYSELLSGATLDAAIDAAMQNASGGR